MEQSNESKVTETVYKVTIYVAGPFTHPNPEDNLLRALEISSQLIDIGAAPFCPHLFYYYDLIKKRSYNDWLELCFKWVSQCDLFYRISGYSTGSDKEEALAFELGKPIFKSINEVRKWLIR
jgi:hypothetical protein